MKIRKSSSLIAAGCTLCVAAASGTVAPQAAAAVTSPKPQSAVSTVSRDVALTASFDPLLLASLPLQNSIAIANALINVFPTGILAPANTVFGQLTTGQVDKIPGTIQTGVQNEITSIANLLNLPAQIIQTDLAALGLLTNAAQAGAVRSNALAANAEAVTPLATAPDPTTILLGLASLPIQDAIAIANAFTAVFATGILAPANQVFAALTTGATSTIPGIIQTGIQNEIASINALAALPGTLVQKNIAYLESLFTTTQATVNRTAELATAPTVQVAADPTTGLLTLVSLPLQNAITVTNALINVFPTGVVAPANTVFAQLTTGQVDKIPATIQDGFTKELAAINTLLGLPATIIAQDVATIQKVFGTPATTLQKPAAITALDSVQDKKIATTGLQTDLTATQKDQKVSQLDEKKQQKVGDVAGDGKDKTPVSDVKDKTPVSDVKDKTPADGVKDKTPADGVKDKTPTDGVKDKTPVSGVKDKTPTTGVKDKTAKADAGGDTKDGAKDGAKDSDKTGGKHAKSHAE